MSTSDPLIFEVSQANFDTVVILNSNKIPVLVEFMGVWSEHCMKMETYLTSLAKEFPGQFIFAKVDVEEQQELRKQHKIENIPTLIVFKDGAPVRTEEGVLKQEELRALLKDYSIFRASDELREQAREKHLAGDTMTAIQLLTQAIQSDPGNVRIAMDMVQVFLDINEIEQARSLYERLPENERLSETGRVLSGQLTFKELAAKTNGKELLTIRLAEVPDDLDASFDLAICLVAEHNFNDAIERLFHILKQDIDYKDGAAREMVANISNMLSENDPDLAQDFRRRLSSLLS